MMIPSIRELNVLFSFIELSAWVLRGRGASHAHGRVPVSCIVLPLLCDGHNSIASCFEAKLVDDRSAGVPFPQNTNPYPYVLIVSLVPDQAVPTRSIKLLAVLIYLWICLTFSGP